jgi:hypothetical protein
MIFAKPLIPSIKCSWLQNIKSIRIWGINYWSSHDTHRLHNFFWVKIKKNFNDQNEECWAESLGNYNRLQSVVSIYHSPYDEHQSSSQRPVKLCSDQSIFQFLFKYIQCSPEGKCKICDTIKDKINSSRSVAVIQRGPWSWTNSIIFIIAESRWTRIRHDVAHNEQLHFCTMYFINLHVQSISIV